MMSKTVVRSISNIESDDSFAHHYHFIADLESCCVKSRGNLRVL
jgi:hypothetical protein